MTIAFTGKGDAASLVASSAPTYSGFTVAAGEGVVIVVVTGTGGDNATAVSDGTNSYTQVGAQTNNSSFRWSIWYKPNVTAVTGGTLTVTKSSSGSNNAVIWARFTGLDLTAAAQGGPAVNLSAGPGTGANAVVSGALTASSQPAALVGFAVNQQGGTTTVGSGFTDDGNFANLPGSGFGWQGRIQHEAITDLASHTSTNTLVTGTNNVVSLAVMLSQPPAGVQVLQETATTGASGTAVPLAFVSNNTVGSSGHAVGRALTSTSFTVTDSKGNTWVQRGPVLNDGGAGHNLVQFTCDNMIAGANTVTLNCSPSGSSIAFWIREIGSTAGFDTHMEQVQVAFGSAATDAITSGVMAPSTTPGLVSAFCNIAPSTPPVLSVGTGYTQDTAPWGAGSSMSSHLRYSGTIANQAATFTASTVASTNAFTFAAMFKETGASTPTVLAGAASPTSGGTSTALATSKFSTRNSVSDTAAFSGFVTSLNIYVNSLASATVIYLGLYDTSNNLLCTGQVNLSLGLNTIGIANGPFLTAGQSYWLGAESDGSPVPADDSASSQRNQINNTTFPLPTGLIFPGSTVTGGRMSLWAAGIAGTVPTSPLYYRRNVLYFIN